MCARSQPKYQHACIAIAETWNRFGPVLLILVGATFFEAHFLAVRYQSRTQSAGDYFLIEDC
jgi:hypothetical protein